MNVFYIVLYAFFFNFIGITAHITTLLHMKMWLFFHLNVTRNKVSAVPVILGPEKGINRGSKLPIFLFLLHPSAYRLLEVIRRVLGALNDTFASRFKTLSLNLAAILATGALNDTFASRFKSISLNLDCNIS